MARIVIIMNQASGEGAKERQSQLRQLVADAPEPMDIQEAAPGELLPTIARAAAQADILVAAGGDGTVSAVAAAAIERGLTFGVIPFGTLNHFAADAGIPTDIAEAVQVIAAGHTTQIDYATVAGTVFLNNASLGVYPTLVRRRERHEKRLGKWRAAIIEAWGIVRQPIARQALTITTQSSQQRLRSAFVFIGNNNYHLGDVGLGSRTSLTGGHLSLFAFRSGGRLSLLLSALRTLLGRTNHPAIISLTETSLIIAGRTPKLELSHDGEVDQFDSPVKLAVHPRGLRLLAPPEKP